MHRLLVRPLIVIALGATALGTLAAPPGAAASGGAPSLPTPAHVALERAAAALQGTPAARRPAGTPAASAQEATLALTDLFRLRPDLTGADRRHADALLARPSDGVNDPYGDGYVTPSTQMCDQHFCLHWVTIGADAPPSTAWVQSTLALLDRVWSVEVGRLGYRAPLSDAGYSGNGGDGRFDVYLKDVGSRGLYGYCAPEHRAPNAPRTASGFCVLDNDFSSAQFGIAPQDSRAVTAAHEFFHAVQFAYDAQEDPWFMESTATWMEERVAGGVDDNRQYLPYSQVHRTRTPLDLFDQNGFEQYGNWAFWEYLSERHGNGVVKRVWNRAAAFRGAPDDYSTAALDHVLSGSGGLTASYARFASANLAPAHFYREGRAWPSASVARAYVLTATHRRAATATRVDHLASASYRLSPGDTLRASAWRARISVTGPSTRTSPLAVVLLRTTRGWRTRVMHLRHGRGSTTIPFSSRTVQWAGVTLVNASDRFRCGQDSRRQSVLYSCRGHARDDDRRFTLSVTARRS